MRYHEALVARLASKFVLDILPATTASLIGGLLLTHYGLTRASEPAAAQMAPASAEMMQLLRDEHGLIVSFLNAQVEREKTQLAAEDAVRHGSGEVPRPATANIPAQTASAAVAAKSGQTRPRMAVASAAVPASAPLVIAEVHPAETLEPPAPASQSLIGKTMVIKDHVVSVTHRVVSTLGGIPNWIGRIGDHLGGTETKSRPLADAVAAS